MPKIVRLLSMNLYFKFMLTVVFSFSLLGCKPIIADNNQIGKLVKEETVRKNNTFILLQAYTVSNYDKERIIIFWCKSKNTENIQSQTIYSNTNVKLKGNGWKQFSLDHVYKLENKKSIVKNLGANRIHIVDENFILIDRGMLDFSVSFDNCLSIDRKFFKSKVTDRLDESDRLFRTDELSIVFKTEIDGLIPESFSGHTHQIVKGTSQYCFNINKEWIADKNNQYQVCTEDKGKSWYATRKIGDGKVMKRLAGSEEWVSHD